MKEKTYNSAFTRDDTAIAKILALLLMMCHHLYAFPKRLHEGVSYASMFSLWGENIEYQMAVYGKLCVAIFAFLSGYGLYLSFARSNDQISVVSRHVKHLYAIYWKVFVIFIPIGIYLGAERIDVNLIDMFRNFLAVDITYNGEWWFITPYLLTLLMMPTIYQWLNRPRGQMFSDILWVTALVIFIQYVYPQIMTWPSAESFSKSLFCRTLEDLYDLLPPFLMGSIFAKYNLFQKFRDTAPSRWIVYPAAFVILVGSFCLRVKFKREYDYLFAPMFVFGATTLLRDIPVINRLLILLSRHSTYMWLIHSFFIYHFCQEWLFASKNPVLIFLLLFAITYTSALAVDLIFKLLTKAFHFRRQS